MNRPNLSQGLKWATESKLSTNLLNIRKPRSLSSPNPVLFPIHWVSQWTCFRRITADTSTFIIYNQGSNNHASISKAIMPTESYVMNITTSVNCTWQWSTRKAEPLWLLPAHFSFHHLCNSAVLPPPLLYIVLLVNSAKNLKSAFIPSNATLAGMVRSFRSWILPCKQWFLQAGSYATKGEKPLWATVCFFDWAFVQRYGRIN